MTTVEIELDGDRRALVRGIVARHGAAVDELIPIMLEVNDRLGHLPADALDEIARLLKLPESRVHSVASFYTMLSTRALGRHVVRFCESAPCHVAGSRQVWQALQDELGLRAGETSADGKWTLAAVSCPGHCAAGPVVFVDDDVHGNVEPGQVAGLLARYA